MWVTQIVFAMSGPFTRTRWRLHPRPRCCDACFHNGTEKPPKHNQSDEKRQRHDFVDCWFGDSKSPPMINKSAAGTSRGLTVLGKLVWSPPNLTTSSTAHPPTLVIQSIVDLPPPLSHTTGNIPMLFSKLLLSRTLPRISCHKQAWAIRF